MIPFYVLGFVLTIFYSCSQNRIVSEKQEWSGAQLDTVATEKFGKEIWNIVDEFPEPKVGIDGIVSKIIYPEEAKKNNLTGTVVVRCLISNLGNVDSVIVVKSVDKLLDDETVRVMKLIKFSPAKVKRKPVYSWLSIPIKYTLND